MSSNNALIEVFVDMALTNCFNIFLDIDMKESNLKFLLKARHIFQQKIAKYKNVEDSFPKFL